MKSGHIANDFLLKESKQKKNNVIKSDEQAAIE